MPDGDKSCPGVCPTALEEALAPHPIKVRRSSLARLERRTSFSREDVQEVVDKATDEYHDSLSPSELRKIEMDVTYADTPTK